MTTDTHFTKHDIHFIKTSMKLPLLSREKEYELSYRWCNHGHKAALDELLFSYGKLVVSVAFRFRHYGIPFSDLIQEGNLGLLCAAHRFDPERDIRFAAYAKWWILAAMQNYILRNWSIVRTGSTTSKKSLFFKLNHLKKKMDLLSDNLMHTEQHADIAKQLQVSIRDVEEMELRLLSNDLSIHAHSAATGEEWGELLQDNRLNPEEFSMQEHDQQDQHHWIALALERLSEREAYIIQHHRLNDPSVTLDEIGRHLGITKERVRQLEAKSIRKMRQVFVKHITDVKASYSVKV
jgi:RNA polymerase sigma-32 factor